MFAYNPITPDRSGQILAEYQSKGYEAQGNAMTGAAAATAAGMTSMGEGLGKGLKDVGQAVAQWRERTAQQTQNAAELDMWIKSGVLPEELVAQIAMEKNPDKMSGKLAAVREMAQNEMQIKRNAALSEGWAPSITAVKDPVTGEMRSVFNSSPRSAQVMSEPGEEQKASDYYITQDADGFLMRVHKINGDAFPVLDVDGNPVQGKVSGGGNTMADMLAGSQQAQDAGRLARLQVEIEKARADVDKYGEEAKRGWLGPKYGDVLAEKMAEAAELEARVGRGGRRTAAGPAAAGGGQPAAAGGGGGYQEGDVAVNPKTGERIVFQNGQWIPLK